MIDASGVFVLDRTGQPDFFVGDLRLSLESLKFRKGLGQLYLFVFSGFFSIVSASPGQMQLAVACARQELHPRS